MSASRKRAYIVLISTAAAALLVDRCASSTTPAESVAVEPAPGMTAEPSSEASDVPRAAVATGRSPHEKAPDETLSIPELPFPRNLPNYEASAPLRDLFARPGERPRHQEPQPPQLLPGPEDKVIGNRQGRAKFNATHTLDAAMTQDRLKIAIVQGRWLGLGDELDGCTLVDVRGDSAVFRCHDGDTSLRAKPGGAGK